MKFKKYVKESVSSSMVLDEATFDMDTWNPDRTSYVRDEIDRVFDPVQKLIDDGKFDEARSEINDLEAELRELEASNTKKKFFKYPKFILDGQRKRIDMLKSQLPLDESVDDMDKRCENCNTLLSDSGLCPKCDDGEEDYGDELKEELSPKEKLKNAFPEVDWHFGSDLEEDYTTEELSNKEKLKRAYPELNFDESVVSESADSVDIPVPDEDEDSWEEYDDVYDIEDDVEQDRAHAALYGGDRTYCSCGKKLVRTEWGSYCPECEPETAEDEYLRLIDDEM